MRGCKAVAAVLCLPIVALSLAGCGILPSRDTTPVYRYTISPEIAAQTASARCNEILRVRAVEASPPWTTSDMLYRQTEHEVSSFAFHRWAAAPATMIGNALLESAQRSGLYRGVLGPTSPGDPGLILAVSLIKGPLQVFPPHSEDRNGAPSGSREVIALSAALIDAGSGKLLAARIFSGTQAAEPDPYGGVVAANAIAARLIEQMLAWLEQANARTSACGANPEPAGFGHS